MRFKAEIFDNLQYLFDITKYNDHQVHCVIRFKAKLNADVLEKAVNLMITSIPALSRVYKNFGGNSYWEDADTKSWNDLFTVVTREEDFEKFTFSKTNEETGPQIKVCLLQSDTDSLSIIINHMIADGAGIKECCYLLSNIYSSLIKNPEYVPDFIIDADRGIKEIISGIPFKKKLKILLLNNTDNNQGSNYSFPMDNEGETFPFILTYEILPGKYHKIRDLCKRHKVTMNDVILTAYFRVLSSFLHLNGEALNIPIMIDMRRYLKDKSFQTLSNLSSTVIISISVQPGEEFSQTLSKVSSEMIKKKNNYLGLNTFVKLDMLFKIFKNKLGYKILKASLKNPKIGMTNIGVLDSAKLVFEHSAIASAFVCGSIKYRPHFQIAVSSFKDKMTFCINLYGSQQDRDNVSKFFLLMDNELEMISIN